MLDKTNEAALTDIIFSKDELEIFAVARAAGTGLRKTFDAWCDIGRGVEVARKHADAPGGTKKAKGGRFRMILDAQGMAWLTRNEASQVLKVVSNLSVVEAWRAELSDFERIRWSSPQSVLNRCIALRPDGRVRGPAARQAPMTVSMLLKLPASEAVQMIFDRCPAKARAWHRAFTNLLDGVPRPRSGWALDREKAAAAQVAQGAGVTSADQDVTIDISAARRKHVVVDPYDPDIIFWQRKKDNGRLPIQTGHPVYLADSQQRVIDQYAALIPEERRPAYREAVLRHLAPGRPAGGAVKAACIAAAGDGFLDRAALEAEGLGSHQDNQGSRGKRATSPAADDLGIW